MARINGQVLKRFDMALSNFGRNIAVRSQRVRLTSNAKKRKTTAVMLYTRGANETSRGITIWTSAENRSTDFETDATATADSPNLTHGVRARIRPAAARSPESPPR